MADRMRFRYRRELPDGKVNETTSRKTFDGWLAEALDEDTGVYDPEVQFYVAWCRWVSCEPKSAEETGTHLAHQVERMFDVSAKENR